MVLPNCECIIVARKPFKESLIDNVMQFSVGGINIDECRVPLESDYEYKETHRKPRTENTVFDNNHSGFKSENNNTAVANPKGRFPSNVILTYDNTNEQEVCGGFSESNKVNGSITNPNLKNSLGNNGIYNKYSDKQPLWEAYNDSGSAARYFMNCKFTNKDEDVEVKNIKMEDEKTYRLINGDMLEEIDKLEENSIDSIVTDPPYGLTSIVKRFSKEDSAPALYGKDGSFARLSKGFMGKEWDGSGIEYNVETWKKCFRVLKPRRTFVSFWWFKNIS